MAGGIEVEVHVMGPLEKPRGGSEFVETLDEGATIGSLLSSLGYKEEHKRFISIMVNQEKGDLHTVLQDGDKVYLSLLVGGG